MEKPEQIEKTHPYLHESEQAHCVSEADIIELEKTTWSPASRGVEKIPARCICGEPYTVMTNPRLPDGSLPNSFLPDSSGCCRKACSVLEAEKFMEVMNEALKSRMNQLRENMLKLI